MRKVLVALAIVCSMLGAANAQNDDGMLVRVLTVSVQPGMNERFEDYVRAFRTASMEQGLENYWLSAQSISGEPVYRFHTALSDWGDLALPGPDLERAFGQREAERLAGLLGDSVTSAHTAFFVEYPSMSNLPSDIGYTPEALAYIDFTLNPGTAMQYMEMTTKTAEASRAIVPQQHYVAAMPAFAGNGPVYGATGPRTILFIRRMSDMGTPVPGPGQRVIAHFGEEEGGRINGMAGASLAGFEYTLFRTRPDLNYQPAD